MHTVRRLGRTAAAQPVESSAVAMFTKCVIKIGHNFIETLSSARRFHEIMELFKLFSYVQHCMGFGRNPKEQK